jgi:hypothetical protein
VTVSVLINDTDIDGDTLMLVSATSPDGTVTINPDGTLTFQPNPGFTGVAAITYTVSDGNGGVSTATARVVVAPSVFVELPPTIITPPYIATVATETLNVPGLVLDAVQGVNSLNGLSGQLGEHGIVVTAANQASSLNGIAAVGFVGVAGQSVPLQTMQIWQLEQAVGHAGYRKDAAPWDVQGMTGFSLRMNLAGADIGTRQGSQVIIESLVRDRTLIVQISNSIGAQGKTVQEYRFSQANGQPLPAWLDRAGASLLIGQRPANVESFGLKVTVVYTDGTFEEKSVRIETMSGDIQTAPQRDSNLGRPFWQQFGMIERVTEGGTQELANLLR